MYKKGDKAHKRFMDSEDRKEECKIVGCKFTVDTSINRYKACSNCAAVKNINKL